jgi:hypothetical protein
VSGRDWTPVGSLAQLIKPGEFDTHNKLECKNQMPDAPPDKNEEAVSVE